MVSVKDFIVDDPSIESQWRSLILFGRNSASYKFAFARSLLEIASRERTVITLDELAIPFSGYLIEHLKVHDKQGSSRSSDFLNACRLRIKNRITEEELLAKTVEKGFVNVVDAFQNIAGGELERLFYEKDYSGPYKKIIITDELLKLKESAYYENLGAEVDARWSLVETAWNIGISPHLLQVEYDELGEMFFIKSNINRRVDITSSRSALNGYQKGKCFYCCCDISIIKGAGDLCHVDHFLPHVNKLQHLPGNINGVWNLVLACSQCNGASEKGAKIPGIEFLAKLSQRNEYYVSSKHPLSETIQNQTGKSERDRRGFLNKHFQIARNSNPTKQWKPKERLPCPF